MSREQSSGTTLRVNPIRCDAHGVCIEAFPEMITRDPWGYPILAPGPIPKALLDHARRAVTVCPALALTLVPADEPRPR